MIAYQEKKRSTLGYKILCSFVAFTFMFSMVMPPQLVSAQVMPPTILNLPVPGAMVTMSPGFIPTMMTGITIHPDNPLRFDFIIDTGHSDLDIKAEEFKGEAKKLINYFMASLTVPEDQLWVNLSPYEKDRIIAKGFSDTEMGRDMLAQDYLLKQLTASLMYPEDELGKKFWDRVYKKAYEQFGVTEIPMNTFNKIWIVPDEATVYEDGNNAFVINSQLAVMLEEDYLALSQHKDNAMGQGNIEDKKVISGLQSQVLREVLIPEIEKEINEGSNFANLRQIYNSLILATWYKERLKDSLLGQVYVDQNKTSGIDIQDKQVHEKIYNQYLKAFEKGVYNYIREDYDEQTEQIIPRKYFSGGVSTRNPVKNQWLTQMVIGGLIVGATALISLPVHAQENARRILSGVGTQAGVTADLVENAGNGGAGITIREGTLPQLALLGGGTMFEDGVIEPGEEVERGGVVIQNRSSSPVRSQDVLNALPEAPDGVERVVTLLDEGTRTATPVVSSPVSDVQHWVARVRRGLRRTAELGLIVATLCVGACGDVASLGEQSDVPLSPVPVQNRSIEKQMLLVWVL